ncbi:MAG: hypothetical protein JXJ19_08170 [Elusimicrobia bacterium]|nr:hypothetical protein [Elusimicrobiota bacterium]
MPAVLKKITTVLLILVLVSLAGLYAAFKIIFSSERLKNSFKNAAKTYLGREVSIGSAELRVGRLVLNNIEVDFKENNKGLAKDSEKFIICKRVYIKFRILPLFRKRFVFKEVKIDTPVINLMHRPSLKLKDMMRNLMGIPVLGGGLSFGINKLSMQKGRLNLHAPALPEWSVYNIGFFIKGTTLAEPVRVYFSCSADMLDLEGMELSARIDAFRNTAEIEKFVISGYGGEADISGSIKDVMTSPSLDLEYFLGRFPSRMVPENLAIDGVPSIKGAVKNDIAAPDISWNMDFSTCSIKYGNIYHKDEGENLKFQGGMTFRDSCTDISWYVIRMGVSSVSGTGMMCKDEVDVNIRGESINLKSALRGFDAVSRYISSGQMDIKGKLGGTIEDKKIKAELNISDMEIRKLKGISDLYAKIIGKQKTAFKLEKVQADISIDKDKIKVINLTSEGGDLEGWGKGYYNWGNDLNFMVYPKFHGREIGLRIYGDSKNVEVGLK